MTSSISDAFLLASYSISKRLLNPKNPGLTPSANVHITYTDSKSDGHATATVQGDGIHLLDVRSPCPRAVEGFDDNVAKGSFPDVDFFTPYRTLSYPRPIDNVRLSRRLEDTGDRWKKVLRHIRCRHRCPRCTCGRRRSGGLETSNAL